MGRFKMQFPYVIDRAGNLFPGADINRIMEICSSLLESETYITAFYDFPGLNAVVVEAENESVATGTSLEARYNTNVVTFANGMTNVFTYFDGLNIIPPLTAAALSGSTNQAKVHLTAQHPNPNYGIAGGSVGGGTSSPYSYGGVPINIKVNLAPYAPTCSCGKDRHGFTSHTTWCDISLDPKIFTGP